MKISLVIAFILMGFTSLVSQSLILRETLITFQGNELTLGLVLASWILLTALGSKLFSKVSTKIKNPFLLYVLFQILLSLYIPISIIFIRILTNILGLAPGEGTGIFSVLGSTFLILAPLNILLGAMFPLACRLWSKLSLKSEESAGVVFILEALGFVIGGLIFTFIFISRLNSFQIVYILGMLNLATVIIILYFQPPDLFKRLLYIFAAFLILTAVLTGPSGWTNKIQYFSIKKQRQKCEVIKYRNTVYGNLALVKKLGQYTIFSNGIPIITAPHPDTENIESLVHFALLSLDDAKDILILGGGLGGVIGEVLKYPISRIDYLESDPGLIEMARLIPNELIHKELENKRVKIKNIDAIHFLNKTEDKYDVIILNLPLVPSLQANRFYSREFISLINKHLKDGGIFVCSTGGSLTYISNELRNLNGTVLNSLRNQFACVSVIPGETNIYLSSNNYFNMSTTSILKKLKEKNISTLILNPAYISYRLSKRNLDWFNDSMKNIRKIKENSNLSPRGLVYSLAWWSSLFSPGYKWFFNGLDKISFKVIAVILCLIGFLWFFIQNGAQRANAHGTFKYPASPKCFRLWLRRVIRLRVFQVLPVLVTSAVARNFSHLSMGLHPWSSAKADKIKRLKKFSLNFAIASTGFFGMGLNLIFIFAYQSFYGLIFSHIALLATAFMAGLAIGAYLMTSFLGKIKKEVRLFSRIEMTMAGFSLLLMPLFMFINSGQNYSLAWLIFVFSFVAGVFAGLEFPLANKIYFKKYSFSAAGNLYASDLMGACLGSLLVPIVLIPMVGILETFILLAILKLFSMAYVVSSS